MSGQRENSSSSRTPHSLLEYCSNKVLASVGTTCLALLGAALIDRYKRSRWPAALMLWMFVGTFSGWRDLVITKQLEKKSHQPMNSNDIRTGTTRRLELQLVWDICHAIYVRMSVVMPTYNFGLLTLL